MSGLTLHWTYRDHAHDASASLTRERQQPVDLPQKTCRVLTLTGPDPLDRRSLYYIWKILQVKPINRTWMVLLLHNVLNQKIITCVHTWHNIMNNETSPSRSIVEDSQFLIRLPRRTHTSWSPNTSIRSKHNVAAYQQTPNSFDWRRKKSSWRHQV